MAVVTPPSPLPFSALRATPSFSFLLYAHDSILRGSSSGTFLSSSALYLYGDSPRPSLFAPADDSNSCIDSLRSGGEYHGGDTRESLSHMRPESR